MSRNRCNLCSSYMIANPNLIGWLSCSCGFRKKEEIRSKEMHIKREELLMGRDTEYPLTPELEANLNNLLTALNGLREKYGKPMIVSSGYRPGKYNVAAGGAKNSSHMSCEACDFKDSSRELTNWCLANLDALEEFGLYMESNDRTPTWVHLQIRRPGSGNRVFKP